MGRKQAHLVLARPDCSGDTGPQSYLVLLPFFENVPVLFE